MIYEKLQRMHFKNMCTQHYHLSVHKNKKWCSNCDSKTVKIRVSIFCMPYCFLIISKLMQATEEAKIL
jgi:hypothetical protein